MLLTFYEEMLCNNLICTITASKLQYSVKQLVRCNKKCQYLFVHTVKYINKLLYLYYCITCKSEYQNSNRVWMINRLYNFHLRINFIIKTKKWCWEYYAFGDSLLSCNLFTWIFHLNLLMPGWLSLKAPKFWTILYRSC